VDPADRKIDFELVEKLGAAFHPRKRQRKAKRK
jgi:hypothetical protein